MLWFLEDRTIPKIRWFEGLGVAWTVWVLGFLMFFEIFCWVFGGFPLGGSKIWILTSWKILGDRHGLVLPLDFFRAFLGVMFFIWGSFSLTPRSHSQIIPLQKGMVSCLLLSHVEKHEKHSSHLRTTQNQIIEPLSN